MTKPFAAFLLCLSVFVGCLQTHGADALPPAVALPAAVKEISPGQVEAYLVEHQDTLIIDVRMEEERRTRGHILNSRHHDYFHGPKALDALAQLDKTRPCILYCAMGGRAQLMAVELHKLGFQNLLLLKGGFNAWVAEGQAVAK
ncbi:MAG: rhodanese-like domain-containing protein [Prosthecobacter sp.]